MMSILKNILSYIKSLLSRQNEMTLISVNITIEKTEINVYKQK